MQLINKSDLLAPGVCVLCESSPSDEVKIVDTLKNLVTGFPFQLQGRKYVCEACIRALGDVIELIPADVERAAVQKSDDAEAKLVAIGGFLDGFAQEIRDGKFAEVTQVTAVPVEEQKSGLEAAVAEGVDPGAVSIAGAVTPPESDSQTVTAAEADTTHAEIAPPTFDPSLTNGAPPQSAEDKAKSAKPKTKDEIAAENTPIAAEVEAQKAAEAEANKSIEDADTAKEGS
jgi:hypothetical protein